MARGPEAAPRLAPSQEYLLLDYVRRLEDHKDDRRAVQIHLSHLRVGFESHAARANLRTRSMTEAA